MDFGLNDEHRAIVATVRDFVRKELVPHEDLVERLDEVPKELGEQIRNRAIAAGLYAPNFPAELGGGGLDEFCRSRWSSGSSAGRPTRCSG